MVGLTHHNISVPLLLASRARFSRHHYSRCGGVASDDGEEEERHHHQQQDW